MITSPIMAMLLAVCALFALATLAFHIASLCEYKAEGFIASRRSIRSLTLQKTRAERTGSVAFAIGFILAYVIVGTIEFQALS